MTRFVRLPQPRWELTASGRIELFPFSLGYCTTIKPQGVRQEAAQALCGIGFSSRQVLSALVRNLSEDSDEGVRAAAVLALHCLDPDGKEALAPIIEAMKDKGDQVRIAAYGTLGAYGVKAEKALPLLTEELKKERVRAEELERQGPRPGVPYYDMESSVGEAIYRIGFALQEAGRADALDDLKAADAVLETRPALKAQYGYGLNFSIRYLEVIEQNSWKERFIGAIRTHPSFL